MNCSPVANMSPLVRGPDSLNDLQGSSNSRFQSESRKPKAESIQAFAVKPAFGVTNEHESGRLRGAHWPKLKPLGASTSSRGLSSEDLIRYAPEEPPASLGDGSRLEQDTQDKRLNMGIAPVRPFQTEPASWLPLMGLLDID